MPIPAEYPLASLRKGVFSQLITIPEDDGWDTDPDPVRPYFQQLTEELPDIGHDQPFEKAPVYKGTGGLPPNVVDMNKVSELNATVGTEFKTLARNMSLFVGSAGMTKPEGATGKLFKYIIPTDVDAEPLTCQLYAKQMQTTALYERIKGMLLAGFTFPFQTAGRANYSMRFLGSGNYTKTVLGGTPTNDAYVPASYFNYQAIINNIVAAGLTNFTVNMDNSPERIDVGGRQGLAGAIFSGYYNMSGEIGLLNTRDGSGIEANEALHDLFEGKTEFPIQCIYADGPFATASEFMWNCFWVRIVKPKRSIGGNSAVKQNTTWELVPGGDWPATVWCDNLGPFLVPASAKLGIKYKGGATIPVAITAGAARTATQIVADLNGDGSFSTNMEADVFMGRIRLLSKLSGVVETIQIDTAQVDSCHALLGFSGTVYAGDTDNPWVCRIWNALGTVV